MRYWLEGVWEWIREWAPFYLLCLTLSMLFGFGIGFETGKNTQREESIARKIVVVDGVRCVEGLHSGISCDWSAKAEDSHD